ncbi:DUF2304 domain-containing protein [Microbacterium sp. HD4P20]|uniref:DUF2304 domain-containing protein n=1 Tax=Microbacterium sp. HD4P20 TaxID=2864874 RepID=UPI001C63F2BD|nr:DUF2304 domain-containing protein [Microbacterium sp. HD4P20]MCP2637516.1 DUF2304 domain-containing protein [Microbacterium sp. HD4P20]
MDQLIIKVLLIAAFLILAIVLLRPTGSARGQALRTIALVMLLVVAIFAIVFPEIINNVAVAVGVGRGADLLLYGLIVVFVANAVTTARKRREQDKQITQLARQLALDTVHYPETNND